MSLEKKISAAARMLSIEPLKLLAVVMFESGGKPDEVNGESGAVGLIQWLPSTLWRWAWDGSDISSLRHVGFGELGEGSGLVRLRPEVVRGWGLDKQVPLLLQYFNGAAGTRPPRDSLQDLYLSVLNPAGRGKLPTSVMWRRGEKAYEQNSGLDRGDKGYITVADAVYPVAVWYRRLHKRQGEEAATAAAGASGAILMVGGSVLMWWLKTRGMA